MDTDTPSTRMSVGSPASEVVIHTEALGREFRKGELVVSDVTMSIHKGEIFGLLGPDGAGKTTLMQMLSGILDPSRGTATVLGWDTVTQAAEVNSHVGYMFQGFTLYDKLSVEENILFSARIRGIVGDLYVERRDRLLKMASLSQFLERPAGNLSGGMRKKLSLCTNLIHEPELLLLDELSLGVDPASRHELWEMLREFKAQGKTIVVTTPYMDEAANCDRLAFFDEGHLLAVDKPENLVRSGEGRVYQIKTTEPAKVHEALYDHDEVVSIQHLADRVHFQMRDNHSLPDDIVENLPRWGGEIEPVHPGLDDIYVYLTGGEKSTHSAAKPPEITVPDKPPKRGAIETDGLTVAFGDFIAVNNVSLEIPPGEVFGFLGANGAGKTTFIKSLCGLVKPTGGDGLIGGIDVRREPKRLRNHIGYMSQRFSLYPDMTVEENLSFFSGVYGLKKQDKIDAMAWAIEVTELHGMETNLVRDMSAAIGQRLALACAIMHQPSVVFLDEPTSGVSPAARYKFWQLIQTLATEGITIFVTTHYLEEANYCHRLGLMHHGNLIGTGTADELRSRLPQDVKKASIEDMFLSYIELENARKEKAAGQ